MHDQSSDPPVRIPPEVLDFLRLRGELNDPDLLINVLDKAGCAQYSSAMQSMGVGERLGLVVLDDANDSNPYCYISGGIAKGMVVHFSHDPEPRIAFESLQAFEQFLRGLKSAGLMIVENEADAPAHPDQARLNAALCELARETESDDAEFLICLYIPLLRGEHDGLLQVLAAHPSFYVREAVAEAIGAHALSAPKALVRTLCADVHGQVRAAAERAAAKRRKRPAAS